MNLVEIKELNCPVCGSEAIHETKKDRHTNGHFNEYRGFKCGATLVFSPNFMKTRVSTECPKSKSVIKAEKLRSNSKSKLSEFIDLLNVDDAFKSRVKSSYEYL